MGYGIGSLLSVVVTVFARLVRIGSRSRFLPNGADRSCLTTTSCLQ